MLRKRYQPQQQMLSANGHYRSTLLITQYEQRRKNKEIMKSSRKFDCIYHEAMNVSFNAIEKVFACHVRFACLLLSFPLLSSGWARHDFHFLLFLMQIHFWSCNIKSWSVSVIHFCLCFFLFGFVFWSGRLLSLRVVLVFSSMYSVLAILPLLEGYIPYTWSLNGWTLVSPFNLWPLLSSMWKKFVYTCIGMTNTKVRDNSHSKKVKDPINNPRSLNKLCALILYAKYMLQKWW